jgi:hypothetical protein
MGSVLRSLLGLGQFPPSLRCRDFLNVPRLRVQQCAVAFEPDRLFTGGRSFVVSRCGLAVVCRQAPDRWHGIYVGRTVPTLGAPTLAVPRCPPGAATRSTAPHGLRPPRFASSVLDCGGSPGGVALLGSNSESELRVCRPDLPPCVRASARPSGPNLCRASRNHLLADPSASRSGFPSAVASESPTQNQLFLEPYSLVQAAGNRARSLTGRSLARNRGRLSWICCDRTETVT